MAAFTARLKAGEALSLASSSITGTYQLVGNLAAGASVLRILNASNQAVQISYDGSTDHDALPAGESLQIDAGNLLSPTAKPILFNTGTPIYVKGTGGTGTIYVAYYYIEQRAS